VGGEDGVGVAGVEERREEFVANVAGGFFDGLRAASCTGFGDAAGDVCVMKMERDVELDAEVFDELLVGVGFCCAKTVMDVDGTETYAKGFARRSVCCVECEEKRDRVCATGDGDTDAVSGFDLCSVEGKSGGHCPYVSWLGECEGDSEFLVAFLAARNPQ
jgi:hypothetical protein